ncbi:hypothetical protein QE152_g15552 [Popillia japonica]|uniref:Uncharacterized protein n=1 Tax=Popillia japonica TaxID=7064 RepID=A0AAW1L951_POPJA
MWGYFRERKKEKINVSSMSSEDIYNLLEEPDSEETDAIGESSGSEDKHTENNEYNSSEIEVDDVDQNTDIAEHGESKEEEDQDFYIGRSKNTYTTVKC